MTLRRSGRAGRRGVSVMAAEALTGGGPRRGPATTLRIVPVPRGQRRYCSSERQEPQQQPDPRNYAA